MTRGLKDGGTLGGGSGEEGCFEGRLKLLNGQVLRGHPSRPGELCFEEKDPESEYS